MQPRPPLPAGLDLAITGGQGFSVTALIGLTDRRGVQLPLASAGALALGGWLLGEKQRFHFVRLRLADSRLFPATIRRASAITRGPIASRLSRSYRAARLNAMRAPLAARSISAICFRASETTRLITSPTGPWVSLLVIRRSWRASASQSSQVVGGGGGLKALLSILIKRFCPDFVALVRFRVVRFVLFI
jgi:hypothetical protein